MYVVSILVVDFICPHGNRGCASCVCYVCTSVLSCKKRKKNNDSCRWSLKKKNNKDILNPPRNHLIPGRGFLSISQSHLLGHKNDIFQVKLSSTCCLCCMISFGGPNTNPKNNNGYERFWTKHKSFQLSRNNFLLLANLVEPKQVTDHHVNFTTQNYFNLRHGCRRDRNGATPLCPSTRHRGETASQTWSPRVASSHSFVDRASTAVLSLQTSPLHGSKSTQRRVSRQRRLRRRSRVLLHLIIVQLFGQHPIQRHRFDSAALQVPSLPIRKPAPEVTTLTRLYDPPSAFSAITQTCTRQTWQRAIVAPIT